MSATTTTTPASPAPVTVPASQVIPFPLPWGNIPGCAPGCVPAGGMDALMKCYMDIKAAMAFISKVMIDLINNDPAVAQAMIAAIEKSGSAMPLIGVTNGQAAQPGQVGEYVQLSQTANVPTTAGFYQSVTMGVLQPGDWDCFAAWIPVGMTGGTGLNLSPQPAGFANNMHGAGDMVGDNDVEGSVVITMMSQALISVPTLVVFSVNTNISGSALAQATTAQLLFAARRAR